ncbi:MAG: S8 family serine peptidase [Planctomycetota bacterium]|nr:S8 family serine peptidase [Planctomycetota bacterium]
MRLEIEPDRLAIFIADTEDPLFAVEEQLRTARILEQVRTIEETRYPGLLILELMEHNASEVLIRLDSLPSGWAAPCLNYRGRLHIPRPEILVSLDPDDPQAQDRVLRQPGISLIREFPSLEPLLLVSQATAPRHIEQRMAQLLSIEGVIAASPNFIMDLTSMAVPNDTFFGSQWHLQNTGQQGNIGVDIDAADAWGIQTGSSSVRIAILDEGVDVVHEDLISHIVAGHDSTSQSPPAGIAGNCAADDGHGTSCAGLAAAQGDNGIGVTGVVWSAQIQPVRLGFGDHWTENAWIIDAITWATDNGADILSNSWGGGSPSTAEQASLQYALTVGRAGLGCLVVFSSGNENTAVTFPAAYPETIAVGASSPCDERKSPSSCDGDTSWGSNFGTQQTVIAPGVLMATTDNSGAGGFVNGDYIGGFGGTSSAAPVVAGALALLLSQDATLTAAEAQSILETSSEDQVGPPGEDTPGFDIHFGHGRINLANMLLLMGSPEPPDNFTCSELAVGVQLSWTPGEPYDQVLISRDGVLQATLGGNATGFLDTSVSTGLHTWEVQGVVGSQQTLSRSCTLLLLGDARDLVYSPETGAVDSGTALIDALIQSGRSLILTSSLTAVPVLDDFDRIWVQLGMFPSNHTLTTQEGDLLDTYLTNGIGGDALYLEGGDTWFFDPQTSVHARFGITALADGASVDDLALIVGFEATGCDLSGLNFDYSADENTWVDRLAANVGSSVVQSNDSPAYDVAVHRNTGTFKTFGASYELGGLIAGASTRLELIEALVQCLADILIPVSDLVCSVSGSSVQVSWSNPGGWDSIEVSLDGAAPVVLGGSATTTTFTGLLTGAHVVEVVSVSGTESALGIACSFGVSPASPTQVLCQQQGADVQISWVNGQSYEAIEVLRDGFLLDTLAGNATTFVDLAPVVGPHQYFVQGTVGGFDSLPGICGLLLGPVPVNSLDCNLSGGIVTLTWVNGAIYDSIDVLRDGILIGSVGGSATSFTDVPGAGSHVWAVRANSQGIPSPNSTCSLLVPPSAPFDLNCVATGPEVSLQWSNEPGYDQVIVSRDGIQIASLSGMATSHLDTPGPGVFLYEIAGANGAAVSDAISCNVSVAPQPVSDLQCLHTGSVVILSWIEESGIDAVEIRRESLLIATVPAGTGFFIDNTTAVGPREYSLRVLAGTLTSTDVSCQLVVPPGSVTGLTCQSLTPETVFMSWSPPAGASDVRIERGGVVVAELPVSITSFVEDPAPVGIQIYSFIPSVGGVDGAVNSCAVDVQQQFPPPVAGFSVSSNSGTAPLLVEFTDTSTGVINTWIWQFGDGFSSSLQNPIHMYTDPGTFEALLTISGSGGSDSSTTTIFVSMVAVPFIRADGNGDGFIDISDPIQALDYIFGTGQTDCIAALDFDDGGEVDIADAIAMLNFIFGSGGPPQVPFPDCGVDPTPDSLGCTSTPNCP